MSDNPLTSLIDELARIGRHKAPLDPSDLLGYPVLLASPGVRRLAGQGASDVELAERAVEALRAAIEQIDDDEERAIAIAMFAASAQYVNMNVTQRKERLKEDEAILPSKWDSKRVKVLRKIAYRLRQNERSSTRPPGPSDAPQLLEDEPSHIPGTRLAHASAVLHYAGMATMFIRTYDDVVSSATHLPGYWTQQQQPTTNYLFNAFVAFAYYGLPWSRAEAEGEPPPADMTDEELAPFTSLEEAREWKLQRMHNFSGTVLKTLLRLWKLAGGYSPLARQRVKGGREYALNVWAGELRLNRDNFNEFTKCLPATALERRSDDGYENIYKKAYKDGRRCYQEWYEWLRDGNDQAIVSLTSAAGAFHTLIASGEADSMRYAAQGAKRAIATYYHPIDEQMPVLKGESLATLVDTYFSSTSPLLIKRHIL